MTKKPKKDEIPNLPIIKQESMDTSNDLADIDPNFLVKQEYDPTNIYQDGGLVQQEVSNQINEDEWGVSDLIASVRDTMTE